MKKFISMFLAVVIILSFGTCAFAAEDIPKGGWKTINDSEVGTNSGYIGTNTNTGSVVTNDEYDGSANGLITTNNGTVATNNGMVATNESNGIVTTNNGTVNTNNGTVFYNGYDNLTSSAAKVTTNNGTIAYNNVTVETNNNEVDINVGTITTNNGTIYNNTATGEVTTNDGLIVTNSNTVDYNFGYISNNNGTVKYNNPDATIELNNGTVEQNHGTVTTNEGTVTMAGHSKVITNYGTVINGNIEDETGSIIDGVNTIYGVKYSKEMVGEPSCGKNVVEGRSHVVMTEDEAADANIIKVGYKLSGWKDEDTLEEYMPGQGISVTKPKALYAIWSKISFGTESQKDLQNVYDRYSGDASGKAEGKTFFFKQPADKFQNVSFNGAHLERDIDYVVTEVDGGTQIEFTEEFFDKNQYGTLSVAPIFDGAIYMLIAVNE